jgi:transcription termination/antitermination protein NusG
MPDEEIKKETVEEKEDTEEIVEGTTEEPTETTKVEEPPVEENSDDDTDENAEEVEEKPELKKEVGDSDEDEYLAMLQEDEKKKKEAEAKAEPPMPDDSEGDKITVVKAEKKTKKKKVEKEEVVTEESKEPKIYALRTTANREDQVMSFVGSNAARKKLEVYAVVRPHGMRGYIFIEAGTRGDAEQAAFGVPYARGLLPNIIQYSEIEHMLEQVKKEANIQKNDIAEIISGPFKREKCKITRIDKTKEEVVVELLEAAVPIPLTLKIDAVRVIRRDGKDEKE